MKWTTNFAVGLVAVCVLNSCSVTKLFNRQPGVDRPVSSLPVDSAQISNKGDWRLTISPFQIVDLNQHPDYEDWMMGSGFGISGGADYFYSPGKFLHFGGGLAGEVGEILNSVTQRLYSRYFYVLNNVELRKWTFGYGLHYTINNWMLLGDLPNPPVLVNKETRAMGIALNLQYRISHRFFLYTSYRPNLLALPPTTGYRYEDNVVIGLDWKLRIRPGKKERK